MIRRFSFPVLVVLVGVALTATACTKASPAAPTAVSAQTSGTATALDMTSVGTATGATALARPGAVDAKGLVKSVDLQAHTFVLTARNDKDVDVRVTQKTVFAAGPNPRAKVDFRSLKPGMAVDVVGKIDKSVVVAASVVVLKPRPTA